MQTKRSSPSRWLLPGSLLVLLALSGACSDDDRPPSGVGTSTSTSASSTSSSTSGGVEGGLTDADAEGGEVIGPALCMGLEQKSQDVAEYAMVSAAPAAVGGAIKPGVWVLNDMTFFTVGDPNNPDPPPPGPTGKLARATLVVSAASIRRLEARGPDSAPLPADVSSAATYTTSGNKLSTTPVCPTAGGAQEVTYSATANLLTLHIDATHAEIYRFVP